MNSTLLTSRLLRRGTATSLFYEQRCTCARTGRRRSRGTRQVSLSFSCVRLLVKWAKIVFKCQSVWTFIVEPFTWHSVVSVSSAAPSLKVYVLQKNKKKYGRRKKKRSIIFYRSSPVALTRERHISIPEWTSPSRVRRPYFVFVCSKTSPPSGRRGRLSSTVESGSREGRQTKGSRPNTS